MLQKMTFYGYCSHQFSESFLKSGCSMPLSLGSTSPEEEDSHNEWIIVCLAPVCTIISYFIFSGLLKCFCYVFHRVRQLWDEINHSDTIQQFNSHGLESSIVHSLLKSLFKKNNESGNTQSSTDCATCLEEFEEGQWLKHPPNCTHTFHVPCIDHWFQSQSKCPLCRSHVKDLTTNHECYVSLETFLETQEREDLLQERAANYQTPRSTILQNSGPRRESTHAV